MAKNKNMKKVKKHLKGDIKGFKHEIHEDEELIAALDNEKKKKKKRK